MRRFREDIARERWGLSTRLSFLCLGARRHAYRMTFARSAWKYLSWDWVEKGLGELGSVKLAELPISKLFERLFTL